MPYDKLKHDYTSKEEWQTIRVLADIVPLPLKGLIKSRV